MKRFDPDLVFFEPGALDYPLGKRLWRNLQTAGVPVKMTTSHNRVTGIPGETELEKYRAAKRTLVVGVRKTLAFDTSLPSAEYAIPLATGCPGHCHYCYLQTTMSSKPYVRLYVNLDEILDQAKKYIEERKPEITRFEGACTGDPVAFEHLTGALAKYITFMGEQEFGRLRFVTKFANIDSLLSIPHHGHTEIRFSINSEYVINNFEPGTSSMMERIEAAEKVAEAGYPLGFLIAPIVEYDGWQHGYKNMLEHLKERLGKYPIRKITFELIQHRFTKTAKNTILRRYPNTKLNMDEEKRQMKWGRYGKFKYIYPRDTALEMKEFFQREIAGAFPNGEILYFV